ncbi:peptidoglycan-binding domain-containing protein [Streptomyces fulvoviolaceus]|uniref:peptidoglycan-binding domain-containing protein n=1 Tax=Streptomyces fulvoviolaceus TaxID=285535 RepID=UPI000A83F1DE|nr:peptidoglycan-binding domain-containing protein [Streptomyces fulvoviolaceus]
MRIRPFVEVGEPADTSEDAEEPQQPISLPDLGGIPTADPHEPPTESPTDGAQVPRRRRVLLTTGLAAAAVLVTGGFVAGLFSYKGPLRDGSVTGGVRAGVPEESSGNAPSSAGPSRTASSSSQSPDVPASSPDTAPPTSPVNPTGSDAATGAPPGATGTAAPAPSTSDGQAPVLSFGDKGPEVVELQLRLRQIGFYDADADGEYDREVESAVRGYQLTRVVLDDEPGVYGAATRASLESETSEP